MKLAIISTHPIQYYGPVFRALAAGSALQIRVFFTWSQAASGAVFDPGFGTSVEWDIPLLEGYQYEFAQNVAAHPGTGRFWGIRNPGLVRQVQAWGAEAVLVYGWNLASHLHAMRYFNGCIPVFFRGDSTLLDNAGALRAWVRRAVLTYVYRYIDTAIAVGQNNRDYFAWCGIRAENIAIAPHSVDTDRFQDATGRHAAQAALWRTQLHIPNDAIVVLFAAKLIAKKDPLLLLDAFMSLNSSAHLVFVGDGVLEGELRSRATGKRNVHFMPFQNQSAMPAVYRLGDVFVLPSRGPGETWGLAMNEAMACGRAVIASSKVGGARDMVRPGVTGWMFDAGDRNALAATLGAVVALDRARLAAIGRESQQHSLRFSTQESARRIAETVTQVMLRRVAQPPALPPLAASR